MRKPRQRRPATLAQVAEVTGSYEDFGVNLKDFLHELASARRRGEPLRPRVRKEPQRLADRFPEGVVCDALVAATADYLCRVAEVPPPRWAVSQARALDLPWFAEPYLGLRARLLRDTPSAFKDKNIFILPSALEIA